MNYRAFALATTIAILVSTTTLAGENFFNQLGRHLGYGVSDGYHAARCCEPACESCKGSSPVQHSAPIPMGYTHWVPQQPAYMNATHYPAANTYYSPLRQTYSPTPVMVPANYSLAPRARVEQWPQFLYNSAP